MRYEYVTSPTYTIGGSPKGPRIVAGLTLGEAQRPTTIAVVAVSGDTYEPTFECASIHRFRPDTPIRTIAESVADRLSLEQLREGFRFFRSSVFDNKLPFLVIDATLIGERVFAEFERLKKSGTLRVQEFVALQITGGDKLSKPEYRQEAEWFRIPKNDLASVMRVSFETKRFKVLGTVSRDIRKRFQKEIRNFRGRTAGNDAILTDSRERPDDDILLAAASAVWMGSRPPDPPACVAYGWERPAPPEPFHPNMLIGSGEYPPIDMTPHLWQGETTCACGYQYPPQFSMIVYCPACKAERRGLRK